MRVLLVVNAKKIAALSLASAIQADLAESGVASDIFPDTPPDSWPDGECPSGYYNLAFSLGGDGSALFAARTVSTVGVPIIPLNLGTLGFLAAVAPSSWKKVYEAWQKGEATASSRLMLTVTVYRGGKAVFCGRCLNDALLAGHGRMIQLEAWKADGEAGAAQRGGEALIACYRADGLLAATPTGSTAYNAASGGPVVDPEMEAILLTPICPFTKTRRPLVLPGAANLCVRVKEPLRSKAVLSLDGQNVAALEAGDEVSVKAAPNKAVLIGEKASFFETLISKLP